MQSHYAGCCSGSAALLPAGCTLSWEHDGCGASSEARPLQHPQLGRCLFSMLTAVEPDDLSCAS